MASITADIDRTVALESRDAAPRRGRLVLWLLAIVAMGALASTAVSGPQPGDPDCDGPTGECDWCNCGPCDDTGGGGKCDPDEGEACSLRPIILFRGAALERETDLSIPGPGLGWSHTRSYNSRHALTNVDDGELAAVQGHKWRAGRVAAMIGQDGADIRYYSDAQSRYLFTDDESGGYDPPVGVHATLEHVSANDEYVLTFEDAGRVLRFHDFTVDENKRGLIKSETDLYGLNEASYQYTSDHNGRIGSITLPQGWTVVYDHFDATSNNSGRIRSISVYDGPDPQSDDVIQRAEYTYMDTGKSWSSNGDLGTSGDLIQVVVWEQASDGDLSIKSVTQYRYHRDADTQNDGGDHQIKIVLEPRDVQSIIANEATIDTAEDILSASDSAIVSYASRSFAYYTADEDTSDVDTPWGGSSEDLETLYGGSMLDEEGFVKSETIRNDCGCGGGGVSGGVTMTYFYMEGPGAGTDVNDVTRLVIEDTEDADSNAVYRRVYGMSQKGVRIREATLVGTDYWARSKWLGSSGGEEEQIVQLRRPSAHTVIDTEAELRKFLDPTGNSGANDTDTLNSASGFIQVYEYNADGRRNAERVKEGSSGDAYYVWAKDYGGGSDDEPAREVVAEYTYPVETTSRSDGSRVATLYSYTFHNAADTQRETRTTTLPAVPVAQNGENVTHTRKEYFDTSGRLRWLKDERGHVTYYAYDSDTDQLAYQVDDINTNSMPGGVSTPGHWIAWSGSAPSGFSTTAGLNAETTLSYDAQGRLTEHLGPHHTIDVDPTGAGDADEIRQAQWRVYFGPEGDHETEEVAHEDVKVAIGRGYYNVDTDTDVLIEPVTVVRQDKAGQLTQEIRSKRSSGSGALSASDTFNQGDWTAWTVHERDTGGRLTGVRRYHDVPSSGEGTEGTNYHASAVGYDAMGDEIRHEQAGGTIVRRVLDDRDRVVEIWVGTDDTDATPEDPTGGSAIGNNMVLVEEREYDGGGIGDGHVTEVTAHVDGSTTRTTSFTYDFRGRRTAEEGEEDEYRAHEYDNLGRMVRTEQYEGDENGNLLSRAEIAYDDRGRVYEQLTYKVDPDASGTGYSPDVTLATLTWYDAAGNPIKQIGAGAGEMFTKTRYDGPGRPVAQYIGFEDGTDDPFASNLDLDDDILVEQVEMDYDDAGHLILQTSFQRHHDDTTTDGELDATFARRGYQASWNDGAGRPIASANYGTNGGSSLSRPDTVPSRSDTVLVTSVEYNDAGRAQERTDPASTVTRTWHDDLGRARYVVENFDDDAGLWSTVPDADTPPDDPDERDSDVNRVSATTYHASGQVATLTAIDPDHDGNTGDNQTTKYVYGTDPDDADDPSTIARGGLLRAIVYPDSDDPASLSGNGSDGVYDRVELAYNRTGNLIQRKDQREVVRQFEYDNLGRLLHDRVTDTGRPGELVHAAVRRISRTYEVRGMLAGVTSHNNATPGSGSVLNEVEFSYNDFGQLVGEAQEHDGTVDGSTPEVAYGHADGSDNVLRPTTITYPDGRELSYNYGSGGSMDDRLGRVAEIEDDDSTVLAGYQYLGQGQVVEIDYEEADVRLDHASSAYAALDRFGRVDEQRWEDYDGSTDLVHHEHAYDRVGNRLYREDVVAGSGQDELYSYDDLHRLIDTQRGTLNGNKDGINSLAFRQNWLLDGLGNWAGFDEDLDGSGWDLEQTRAHSDANEITSTTETTGSAWAGTDHDAAGNMTQMPAAHDPTKVVYAIYDAWNRLAELNMPSGSGYIQYHWDGMGRRVVVERYGEALEEATHFYYTIGHQILEVRVDGTSTSDLAEQYIWGLRYIDELILRDRDTTGNAELDERVYALQDANFNVVAIVDDEGTVVERYRYTPYGRRTVLNANFTVHADPHAGGHAFAIGHQGLHHDGDVSAGLIYNRARMLHPRLGRFVQRDPLNQNAPGGGYQDGLSVYEYVRSNAINYRDPEGTTCVHPDTGHRVPRGTAITLSQSVTCTRHCSAWGTGASCPWWKLWCNNRSAVETANARFTCRFNRAGLPTGLAWRFDGWLESNAVITARCAGVLRLCGTDCADRGVTFRRRI